MPQDGGVTPIGKVTLDRRVCCCPAAGYLDCLDRTKRSLITATAAASCIGTFLMGIGGNLPLGIAPGMGLNAYFAVRGCDGSTLVEQRLLSPLLVLTTTVG